MLVQQKVDEIGKKATGKQVLKVLNKLLTVWLQKYDLV